MTLSFARFVPALALVSVPLTAQGTRVNAPVVAGGHVDQWQIARDGSRVFYAAVQTTLGVREVHDVPLDGSQATRVLSAPLAPGRTSTTFQVAPDESRVAYVADQDTDDVFELYVVPSNGSRVSTKVSGTLPANGDVFDYRWSTDGARLLFTADAIQDGMFHLYSAPANGSAPPVLLHPKAVTEFAIGAHTDRIAFGTKDTLFGSATALYSAPIDGSAPATLLSNAVQTWFIDGLELTPDDGTVVYAGSVYGMLGGEESRDSGMYSVPIDGSAAPIELVPRVSAYDWEWEPPEFVVAADGQHVVANLLSAVWPTRKLFARRVDGQGALLSLNNFGFPNRTEWFRVEPNGEHVVYVAKSTGTGPVNIGLLSARLDGSTPPLSLGAVTAPEILAKPEVDTSGRAVFAREVGTISMLLSKLLDDSAPPIVLSNPMVAGGHIYGMGGWGVSPEQAWWIDPYGKHVVYKADGDTDNVVELYCAPIAGGVPAVKVSGPMVAGGNALVVQFAPPGRRLVYSADQEVDGATELFMSSYGLPLDGPSGRAHVPPPAGSAVRTVP